LFVIIIGLVAFNYKGVSLTIRENKEINDKSIPHYYMMSLFNIAKDSIKPKQKFLSLKNQTNILEPNKKITGIIVLGETARAVFF